MERFFRCEKPYSETKENKWIEITGREFFAFVHDPHNKERYFLKLDNDLVIECSKEQSISSAAEDRHKRYLHKYNSSTTVYSLQHILNDCYLNGEEAIIDVSENTEEKALAKIETGKLKEALKLLNPEDYYIIYALYLAPVVKTSRILAEEFNVSHIAIIKSKNRILKLLRKIIE